MQVLEATAQDFGAFVTLAADVEDLFGPMVDDPGFHEAVHRNIARRSALIVRTPSAEAAGGLLFSSHRHPRYTIGWLVVAEAMRSQGLGQALVADAFQRWLHPPCVVDVVTFGADHPGARSRAFYERLGFEAAEVVENGPEGGSRQVFRLRLDSLPRWS